MLFYLKKYCARSFGPLEKVKLRLSTENSYDIIKYYEKFVFAPETVIKGGGILTLNYNKLWKMLIDKNISRTQLVRMSKISTNAMAKMGKNQEVRMETMVKICDVLHCKIDDVVDYSMVSAGL